MKTIRLLVAEDNDGDVFLIEEALRAHNLSFKIDLVQDGMRAEAYLNRLEVIGDAICPDVFLLDLNLPKGDGHAILKSFRQNRVCARVPVIIITSSDAPRDRQQAELLGAAAYFRKPSDLTEFLELGAIVSRVVNNSQ